MASGAAASVASALADALAEGLAVGLGDADVALGDAVALAETDAPAGADGVTFRNLPSGSLLPVRARRVLATGTTAADLLVLL